MRECHHPNAYRSQGPYCPRCGKYLSSEDWQDVERTYTPAEQQLDMRYDCRTMRGGAALAGPSEEERAGMVDFMEGGFDPRDCLCDDCEKMRQKIIKFIQGNPAPGKEERKR